MSTARYPADEAGVSAHIVLQGQALDGQLTVSGADGHHLERVRRLRAGEEVTVADGAGAWRRYRVGQAARGSLDLSACADECVEPEPYFEIVAAPALIARNRFDDVVAHLTELGVDAIVPLLAQRCVVRAELDPLTARLRAIAREASMQCRRSRVPRVDAPATPAELATRCAAVNARIVVASHEGARDVDAFVPAANNSVCVVNGPEGGLSPDDLAAFGVHESLRLGAFVLRAETASLAAVAQFTQRRERCGGC